MTTSIPDKRVEYLALSSNVLVVAKYNPDIPQPDWAAYIDAVPGVSHSHEWEQVARTGTKLPYPLARLIFPQLDNTYTWRP